VYSESLCGELTMPTGSASYIAPKELGVLGKLKIYFGVTWGFFTLAAIGVRAWKIHLLQSPWLANIRKVLRATQMTRGSKKTATVSMIQIDSKMTLCAVGRPNQSLCLIIGEDGKDLALSQDPLDHRERKAPTVSWISNHCEYSILTRVLVKSMTLLSSLFTLEYIDSSSLILIIDSFSAF